MEQMFRELRLPYQLYFTDEMLEVGVQIGTRRSPVLVIDGRCTFLSSQRMNSGCLFMPVFVEFKDPAADLDLADNSAVQGLAKEVRGRLERVIATLRHEPFSLKTKESIYE